MASTFERVQDIVAEQLGVDKEKIKPETSFVNDLGADSLDTVELVMELEEEFDINIPDDAAEKIQTVGQAIVMDLSRHMTRIIQIDAERNVARVDPNPQTWRSVIGEPPTIDVCWVIDVARWKATLYRTLR